MMFMYLNRPCCPGAPGSDLARSSPYSIQAYSSVVYTVITETNHENGREMKAQSRAVQ